MNLFGRFSLIVVLRMKLILDRLFDVIQCTQETPRRGPSGTPFRPPCEHTSLPLYFPKSRLRAATLNVRKVPDLSFYPIVPFHEFPRLLPLTLTEVSTCTCGVNSSGFVLALPMLLGSIVIVKLGYDSRIRIRVYPHSLPTCWKPCPH